jgi:hypothetical protein
MKAQLTMLLVWLVTGLGAVAGSILGGAGGRMSLFAGAVAGGLLFAVLGVWLCAKLGWLAPGERRLATMGALLGFLIAAPVAVLNLDTPITPIFACAMAGIGALIGAGRARAAR